MIFKKEYIIHEKIGETSASIIYKSIFQKDNKPFTIKMERHPYSSSYLLNETKIRKLLNGVSGIPQIIDYGIYKSRRYIIYPYIEESLFKKKLSIPLLFSCAVQIIGILNEIHKKGILHCDISATNLLFDKNKNIFYLSDFGQSKHYSYIIDSNKSFPLLGCPLFCSEYVHEGKDYSFRDDMISFGYLLYYLIEGELPWCGLTYKREVYEQKVNFRRKYWNLNIPNELKIYLNYCFHLGINERPEYNLLKKLFQYDEKQIEIQT